MAQKYQRAALHTKGLLPESLSASLPLKSYRIRKQKGSCSKHHGFQACIFQGANCKSIYLVKVAG